MKRLRERLWAKVLAGALCVVFAAGTVLCAGGTAWLAGKGCTPGTAYESTEAYEEQMFSYTRTARYLHEEGQTDTSGMTFLQKQQFQDTLSAWESQLAASGTNFRYVVLTSDGSTVLGGNVASASALRAAVGEVWHFQYSDGLALYHYRDSDTGTLYTDTDVSSALDGQGNTESFLIECGTVPGLTNAIGDGFAAGQARFLLGQQIFPWAVGGICVSAVLTVLLLAFLTAAAGHRRGREGISLNAFDRLWLEPLWLCLVCGAAACLVPVTHGLPEFSGNKIEFLVAAGLGLLGAFSCALPFWMTLVSRCKGHALWHSTSLYQLCRLARYLWRGLRAVTRNIRVTWKLAAIFALFLLLSHVPGLGVLVTIAALAALLWWGEGFLRLKKGGKALAGGDISYKVDTARLYPELKEHAEDLNAIAQGMGTAIREQMKSDHLRSELITNVSHDIKTPLTSIINYVDLLQADPAPEQRKEYLAVLARQSARLKKLTEDLLEASKASTGNVTVSLAPMNVRELVSQAVGEYDERLAAAGLTPVVRMPEAPLRVMADGRLLWRVLDNLLSNACKYALSGTRLYVDGVLEDGKVLLTVKNISRQALNISPDELMERFVRGDRSRNTEGSGLGLSIARSLTELQHGSFDVKIDGDLFRAEVRLDAAPEIPDTPPGGEEEQ